MSDPTKSYLNGGGFKGVPAAKDFTLVSEFLGYRSKEDQTNLMPGILVKGSKNVLTTTGGDKIRIRQGYTLYGQVDPNPLDATGGIDSSFDWEPAFGEERHLRAGFGKLQYLFGQGTTTPTWKDLMTGLTTTQTDFEFVDYWDNTNVKSLLLFVNGTSNIYEWSGGVTTYASDTAATITKQGTETWAEIGFSATGSVVINGTTYAYTGGSGTTTLTGVTPNPTLIPKTVGESIHQLPVTHANSSLTSISSTNPNDHIGIYRNQIYIGSNTNRTIYVSKINDFTDFSFSTPVRFTGEGALLTLDGTCTGFETQENNIYISAGKDYWYNITFTLTSDNISEQLTINRLKTGPLQGAISSNLMANMPNNVMFVSYENIMYVLGRVENIVGTPQNTNYSDPIKNDFSQYDFTDGQIFYHKNFIYVTAPRDSTTLIYNLAKQYWEAPQILPIAKFSVIDGDLYGHSYSVVETYKMFNGYNDNGGAIDAVAKFSFQNYGTRSLSKYFTEFYSEGYIEQNTTLKIALQLDFGSKSQTTYKTIVGNDTQTVAVPVSKASIGKESFGKNPFGGDLNVESSATLSKFRQIDLMPLRDFWEAQYTYSTNGKDQQWEILSFGALTTMSAYGNNAIKK